MSDDDFNKLAEVLILAVNIQMGNSMTIEGVTLGYHKLISLGNYGLTATEINLGYKVSTNLPASTVGDEVARAVGRSKKAVLSLLQGQSEDAFPYFLEVDEIHAQNIASIGDPNGAASLPNVIPQKPITQPPEEDSDLEEGETGEFTGPLVGELLAEEAAAGNEVAEKEVVQELANATVDPVVKNDPGGLGSGVLGLTYRQFEKKRRLIVEQRRKLDEEDVESDFESNKSKSSSQQNVIAWRRSSITDIESGKTSMSRNDSPNIPELNSPIRRMSSFEVSGNPSEIQMRNSGRRRSSLGSQHSSMKSNNSADFEREIAPGNQMLSKPRNNMKRVDERSFSSSDSDSSRSSDSHHSGTTSGDNSGTDSDSSSASGDDSSSDEIDASSRKAAGTAVVRKKITRRVSLDEDMAEEIKACMHNQSLSTYQRKMKMNEIKSKYNSKKLLEEARGETFQQSLDEFLGGKRAKEKNRRRTTDGIPPPGLRRRRLSEESAGRSSEDRLDEFLGGKRAKEKNRRRTIDGIGGKPPPRLRRRRLSEESSGRSSADRRKALTRTLSAQSLGYQDDKLNSSFQSQSNSQRRSLRRSCSAIDLLATSDHCIERKKFSDDRLNSSFQSQSHSLRRSLRRRDSANDLLANSDHCIEKKKFSDMKVSQRPRHRRRSM
eukprot:scaffold1921_cov112-Skeletonema_dohrnii-CCMP3373.AAC.2